MVMHARKPQRLNDGYFEKHQSHSYQSSKYSSSKRDYERERSSNYRDRDISPIGGTTLNNGNSSYRSQSPEIDSPSSRGHGGSHDIRDRGEHRGGGGDRFSYMQKMRDRDRDVYKKDKYSSADKRDRRNDRDSESHRTNHDRLDRRGGGTKLCSSRERERDRRERDRDRDRDRERDVGVSGERNDRGERVARCGNWSEHVSSSGKMYYYNCKTEVSQWEKPKEWIERERNIARDQHREKDYRDKDRERDREDRFSRSSYSKHSSSRDNSRLRWNYENDSGPPSHRRRLDGRLADNVDMDISPGDSTPTSEASYSMGGTPTTHSSNQHNDQSSIPPPNAGLTNILPRLASHPNTNSLSSSSGTIVSSSMHFSSTSGSSGSGPGVVVGGATMLPATGLASTPTSTGMPIETQNNHRKLDAVTLLQHQSHLSANASPIATGTPISLNQVDHHLNSNAPGPPKLGSKEHQEIMINSLQKSTLHLRPQHSGDTPIDTTNHTNALSPAVISLRENVMNSPLYGLTHGHGMSPMSYTRSPITGVNSGAGLVNIINMGSASSTPASYSSNTQLGLKTVESSGCGNIVNSVGSSSGLCSSSSLTNANAANSTSNAIPGEGPPTPTQELDISGTAIEQQRKVENTSSASLSTLQSCVASSAQPRSQGPEISPKLAKYFRADLISHVTGWPSDMLEKQAQKLAEERHFHGDLQCTKVSTDLKCARSLVRVSEITGILQEQRIMYLRQQIGRLEETELQNSFLPKNL